METVAQADPNDPAIHGAEKILRAFYGAGGGTSAERDFAASVIRDAVTAEQRIAADTMQHEMAVARAAGVDDERERIKAALLAEAETYRLPESAPIRDALRAFAARLGGAP